MKSGMGASAWNCDEVMKCAFYKIGPLSRSTINAVREKFGGRAHNPEPLPDSAGITQDEMDLELPPGDIEPEVFDC